MRQEDKDFGKRLSHVALPEQGTTTNNLSSIQALCDWPDAPFTLHDEPGEHDPCYVVMPGGSSLAVNHHATPGVDIARAKFIVAACNAALALPTEKLRAVLEASRRTLTLCGFCGPSKDGGGGDPEINQIDEALGALALSSGNILANFDVSRLTEADQKIVRQCAARLARTKAVEEITPAVLNESATQFPKSPSPDYAGLRERLIERNYLANREGRYDDEAVMREAATAIESLTAKLGESDRYHKWLEDRINTINTGARIATEAIARAEAAEAKLSSVREAVRTVVKTFQHDEEQGYRSKDRQYAIEMLSGSLPPSRGGMVTGQHLIAENRSAISASSQGAAQREGEER